MMEAVASMEMAPGAIPRPGKVPKQRLLSPELGFLVAAELRNSSGEIVDLFRVFGQGQYIVQRASRGGARGDDTILGRLEIPGRAEPTCRALVAPLRLSFGLQVSSDKIGASVNFRPIPRIFPD